MGSTPPPALHPSQAGSWETPASDEADSELPTCSESAPADPGSGLQPVVPTVAGNSTVLIVPRSGLEGPRAGAHLSPQSPQPLRYRSRPGLVRSPTPTCSPHRPCSYTTGPQPGTAPPPRLQGLGLILPHPHLPSPGTRRPLVRFYNRRLSANWGGGVLPLINPFHSPSLPKENQEGSPCPGVSKFTQRKISRYWGSPPMGSRPAPRVKGAGAQRVLGGTRQDCPSRLPQKAVSHPPQTPGYQGGWCLSPTRILAHTPPLPLS